MDFNKVIILGNLTRDIEKRSTPSGKSVATFSLAVDNSKKNTDFFDIEIWEQQADLAEKYLSKGSRVLIEGRLKQDRWETDSGKKRSKVKIVGYRVLYMDRPSETENTTQPKDNTQKSTDRSTVSDSNGGSVPF